MRLVLKLILTYCDCIEHVSIAAGENMVLISSSVRKFHRRGLMHQYIDGLGLMNLVQGYSRLVAVMRIYTVRF
jgi:hypothetical protein